MDNVTELLVKGAAGAAGGGTYVDDVFSTYLWAGNDESGRSITNGIKLSNNNIGNSVYLNGTNEYLSIPSSSDFAFGTGDFTWEGWFYLNDDGAYLISFGADVGNIDYYTYGGATRRLRYYNSVASHQEDASTVLSLSTWYHIAAARSSNTTKVFLNGTEKLSFTDNKDYGAEALYLGATSVGGSRLRGNISNVRIVKGQALYTSNFTPSTQALTTTSQGATASNVKLLCCNDSSVTGSTVTPDTITNNNGATASIDSPFDDTAAFKFGADENKNITKCGSYDGNGSSTGPEVYLGWEPQFVILKQSSASGNQWRMYDSMRGITTGNDAELYPSSNGEEDPDNEFLELTPTGFKLKTSDSAVNGNTATYIYYCIRRPDAIVGKPASAGTSAFAMDVGNASSTIPTFDSGFPVDFSMMRNPASADPNFIGARLTGTSGNKFNAEPPESSSDFGSQWAWDSNAGWCANSNYSTGTQSWMWKRGQGFDTVTWTGNGVAGREIPHSLNAVPKMMIVKTRTDGSIGWAVYHVGLNGGSNPEQYYLQMPGNDNAVNSNTRWNDTAPTSTYFTVGNSSRVNLNNSNYFHKKKG